MKIKIESTQQILGIKDMDEIIEKYPILKKYNIDENYCIEFNNLEHLILFGNEFNKDEFVLKKPSALEQYYKLEIYDDWRE